MKDDKILQVGVMMGNVHTQHPKEVLRGLYAAAKDKSVNLTLFLGAQGDIFDYWKDSFSELNSEVGDFVTYNYQYNSLYDYAHMADLDVIIIAFGMLSMFIDESHRQTFLDKFKNIPLIIIQEYNESAPYNYIKPDNYAGTYTEVSHLIEEHNYKKILYLSGPRANVNARERLNGYLDAMHNHGLDVEDKMLEYGDYSQKVDRLVERLLDSNPGVEAIAVGNDEMCISVYRVCKTRGIMVGKDIAIVGFDDIDIAGKLVPPLTTIRQDGFAMGRMAMQLACDGVSNTANKLHLLPTNMVKRASCGCNYAEESIAQTLSSIIARLDEDASEGVIGEIALEMTMLSLNTIHSPESMQLFRSFYTDFVKFLDLMKTVSFTEDAIDKHAIEYSELMLRSLYFDSNSDVDWNTFDETINTLVNHAIGQTTDINRLRFYHRITEDTHRYIKSMLIRNDSEKTDNLNRQCWNAALVIQNLKANVDNYNTFFSIAMQQVKEQGAKSAYLYLLEEPKVAYKDDEFELPEALSLVSKYEGEKITIYPFYEGTEISCDYGYTSVYPDSAGHNYVTFLLFSETEQYGLLVCEISHNQVAGMQAVAMQISSGLSFLQMTNRENTVKQELYDTLKVLSEKNKILDAVSSNDPMTGVYNRRGFMERFIEMSRESIGREANFMFCDLDHLKEVNDVFGHNEGDFAIKSLATIIENAVGDDGIVARIGGDEFVAIVRLSDDKVETLQQSIKEALSALNDSSGKSYYVECSIGCHSFVFTEDMQFDELVHKADEQMYIQKKSRRTTICR